MKVRKLVTAVATALPLLFIASTSHAAIVPFGPQNDVTLSQVSQWGFTVCSVVNNATNDVSSRPAAMLSGCTGDYLMMAMRLVGSATYDVLAAANYADVILETGANNNVTHLANGAQWYFNDNFSWGFAGAGDLVSRTSADTAALAERDRLSWHTHDFYSSGWRSGNNVGLNGDAGWEKVLLVASSGNNVPEPETLALFGIALAGLSLTRRKFKQA